MTPAPSHASAARVAGQSILVVDDDRRVVELLEIAFSAHGFRVIRAGDGEEAIRRAVNDRPDLVILDVRLPRKSGLEVCEILRRDPDEPHVPIIMVSAATETDARLRGLAAGADDYVTKPFSPKELIARVKRLLARTSLTSKTYDEARVLRLELERARDDARRSHLEARHETRLREAALGPGRQLQESLDVDEVAQRLLTILQVRMGLGVTALLAVDAEGVILEPRSIRGDGFERIAALGVMCDSELAKVLCGFGWPVSRAELERLPELEAEMPPFIASGFSIVAPLRGSGGLEGVVLADERTDGRNLTRPEREEIADLCETAALALCNARRVRAQADRLLECAFRRRPDANPAHALLEDTRLIIGRAARASCLAPRHRELLDLAIAVNAGARIGDPEFEAAALADPTDRLRDLGNIVRASQGLLDPEGLSVDASRAALLLAVAHTYTKRREAGASREEALIEACVLAGSALEPDTAQALNGALREPIET